MTNYHKKIPGSTHVIYLTRMHARRLFWDLST